jgi:tRNA dimethylallyltransferase
MQVYRGMDIGTAKPSGEEQSRVTHHLIDLIGPEERYTVAEFQGTGVAVLDDLASSGRPAIICGGSGLHFRALVDPMTFPGHDDAVRAALEALSAQEAQDRLLAADPRAGEVVDLDNPRRVTRAVEIFEVTGETPSERASGAEAVALREYRSRVPFVAVGVDPGDGLPERVGRRLDRMLEAGWLEEVVGLSDRIGPTASQAVGYRELLRVVAGEWGMDTARERILGATTSLARRQRTFLRRDPRIWWAEWDDDPRALADAAGRHLEEAGWTS